MTTLRRSLLALAFVGLGLVGPLPLAAAPASAGGAPCSGRTGVTVVVDFGPLSGGTQQACVPGGAGDSAAKVTDDGGFAVTFTTDGQPFVCRISGQPDAQRESCNRTPPEDAYWGLFWSDGTRGWTYSSQGATSLTPKDGWSIGWRFQDGGSRDLPSAGPRRNPAPSPSPSRTPSSPRPTSAASTPRPASSGSSGSSGSSAPAAAGPAPSRSSTSAAATPSRTPSRSASPRATDTATPSATDSEPSSEPSSGPSSEPSSEPSSGPSDDSTDRADGSFATVTSGDDDGQGLSSDRGIAAVAGLAGLSVLAGSAAVVAHRRRGGS